MGLPRILFFAIYCLVYGGINFGVYRMARPLLPQSALVRWGLVAWFALMVLAPAASRLAEYLGGLETAAVFDQLGFYWMGFVFIGFLVLAVVRLVCWPLGVSGPVAAGLGLALTLVVSAYGYYEAANPRLTHVEVAVELPPGTQRIRIAQITDQHLGYTMNSDRLAKVSALVASQNPDMVVSTGDLFENQLRDPDTALAPLAALKPPLGKWAVFGNHEYYMDPQVAVDYHRRAGFRLLRDEWGTADGRMVVAGLDDRHRLDVEKEKAVLASLPKGLPRLVLKHRPVLIDGGGEYFDLMLAGHTHAGQIWPFRYLVERLFPMIEGRYDLPGGGVVFVSRGSGSWGPPVRVLAPPEVVIVDLVPR